MSYLGGRPTKGFILLQKIDRKCEMWVWLFGHPIKGRAYAYHLENMENKSSFYHFIAKSLNYLVMLLQKSLVFILANKAMMR